MLDTNPFRVSIRYRSGTVDTFTAKEAETEWEGTALTNLKVIWPRPQAIYLRLEEIVSVRVSRRFPWGLFA